MELQKKVDQIIKEIIHPVLKSNGFKKSGRNWYRDFDDFGWCFNIQSSLYNSKDEIRFTFNTGIFVKKVYELIYHKSIPNFPKEMSCVIRKRIGFIKKENDFWYSLNGSTNIEELQMNIEEDIRDFIIPYFNNFNSV